MKLLLNILGIILTTTSIIYIISYLNILPIGYNFIDYAKVIIRSINCLLIIPGIIILIINNKGD